MNAKQLDAILKSIPLTCSCFGGVYAGDEGVINKKINKNEQYFIILNTAPAGHPGLHWVLLFKPKNGRKMVFFDSLGNTPTYYGPHVSEAVNHFSGYTGFPGSFYYSRKPIQPNGSILCGLYCLFFAFHLCLGNSINNLLKLFYLKNKPNNDKFILKWSKLMQISCI